jgi:RNA polymerase sigma-70 factor (ECF subfamily)
MGVPRSDLDDLMQEVFLVAHKNGGYVPGPAKPSTYLANIAFKATVSHRRKKKTRSFVRADGEFVERSGLERGTPERVAIQVQELALLQQALDALDEDKRAVFVMAELQGESVVDIAAGLGIPVDTAYSRLRVARKLFRKAAQRLELAPEGSLPTQAEGRSR